MARKLALLIAVTGATASVVCAQERPPVDPLAPAPTSPKPETKAEVRPENLGMRRPGGPGFLGGPDGEKARQALQQMSPEERQKWFQRLKEFSDLPADKKKEIFERSEFLRRKMREDVEAALKESGLTLTDEQKKKFAERYFEERKKIEEELRKQMDEIRQPKLHALTDKLRQEFAGSSTGTK